MSERSPLANATTAAGAVWVDERGWQVPLHFDNMPAEYHHALENAALFDRSQHGKIEVAGPEAATYLHNLCTNDIKSLRPGGGCEAFLTNAKAKIIAFVSVYYVPTAAGTPPTFWLDTGPGGNERVFQHLDRHLISEQVELADRTRDYAQMHVAGPYGGRVVQQALGADVARLAEFGNLLTAPADSRPPLALRRRSLLGLPGIDVLCPSAAGEEVWKALTQAGATPAGGEAFEILRVEAATPLFGVDIDEERFVVEVGRTSAISYAKGCYLGQEPIVMARDRGHVNRQWRGLKEADPLGVPAGAKVFRDGAEVGIVTSSVVSPRFGAIALAYLRRGHWDPDTAVQVEADSEMRGAVVCALPFAGAGAGVSS